MARHIMNLHVLMLFVKVNCTYTEFGDDFFPGKSGFVTLCPVSMCNFTQKIRKIVRVDFATDMGQSIGTTSYVGGSKKLLGNSWVKGICSPDIRRIEKIATSLITCDRGSTEHTVQL